jgi:hypothetical protein
MTNPATPHKPESFDNASHAKIETRKSVTKKVGRYKKKDELGTLRRC